METLDLIDRLEALVEDGKSMFVVDQARLDRQELIELLEELRVVYRRELYEARRLLADGDPLAETRRECERLLRGAVEEAEQRTSPAAVGRISERQASALLTQARRHAFEIGHETNAWVDEILANLEANLGKFAGAVRHGRARLHERSSKESVRERFDVGDDGGHGLVDEERQAPGELAA